MIRVEVKPRPVHTSHDGKPGCDHTVFDIYVHDGQNGNLLVFSNQGYENVDDAEAIARRLFVVADPYPLGETVALKVTYRDGTTKTEQLR